MIRNLAGKTALVTGASQGLGKAMALALAEAGAAVVLVARNETSLTTVAQEIRDDGGRAEIIPADLRDENQVARLKENVHDGSRQPAPYPHQQRMY